MRAGGLLRVRLKSEEREDKGVAQEEERPKERHCSLHLCRGESTSRTAVCLDVVATFAKCLVKSWLLVGCWLTDYAAALLPLVEHVAKSRDRPANSSCTCEGLGTVGCHGFCLKVKLALCLENAQR